MTQSIRVRHTSICGRLITQRSFPELAKGKTVDFSHQGIVFDLHWFDRPKTYGIKLHPIDLPPGEVIIKKPLNNTEETWLVDATNWSPLQLGDEIIFWGNRISCDLPKVSEFPGYLSSGTKLVVDPRKPIDPNLKFGLVRYEVWNDLTIKLFSNKQATASTFGHFGLTEVESMLAFNKQRADQMGEMASGLSFGSHYRKIAWPSVYLQAASFLARESNSNVSEQDFTALLSQAGLFLSCRQIVAMARTGEDLTTFTNQATIGQVNAALNIFNYPFVLGFLP
ncbi:MAG: hypothetical protein WCW67_06670 [Candidatus Margulisiibacteriota bacterium]|jgi:hypothetical protein